MSARIATLGRWVRAKQNRQAIFNVFMSFMAYTCTFQLYKGKKQREALEEDIAIKNETFAKLDILIAESRKKNSDGSDLISRVKVMIDEARGIYPVVAKPKPETPEKSSPLSKLIV